MIQIIGFMMTPCCKIKSSNSFQVYIPLIFIMNSSYKSPGPDGFHPLFFKSQWDIVWNSIHRLVLDCFRNPSSIGDINKTLITLIPKSEDPF